MTQNSSREFLVTNQLSDSKGFADFDNNEAMKFSAKDDPLIFSDLGINEETLVKFEVRLRDFQLTKTQLHAQKPFETNNQINFQQSQ